MGAVFPNCATPFRERSGYAVKLLVTAEGRGPRYLQIGLPQAGATKTRQDLEHLGDCLTGEEAIETDDLCLLMVFLKVTACWAILFELQFVVGEKAGAPETETSRNERKNISGDRHSGMPGRFVGKGTDRGPDIRCFDAPRSYTAEKKGD